MRKWGHIMIIALFIIGILSSCSKENVEAKITIDNTVLDIGFLNAIPADGGSRELRFEASLDWVISVSDTKILSWLDVSPSSGKAGNAIVTILATENKTLYDRQSKITISVGSIVEEIIITQISILNQDREALIALYNATTGDKWINNTNWGSDKPLAEWYGVVVAGDRVVSVDLKENNLIGSIPAEVGNLTNLMNLYLYDNKLTGSIPDAIIEHSIWDKSWRDIITQKEGYGFDLAGVILPGRKQIVTDISNISLNFNEVYVQNKYTVLFFWSSASISSISLIDKLIAVYQQKKSIGLEVITYSQNNANSYIQQHGMNIWKNFAIENNTIFSHPRTVPTIEIIDQKGNIVFTSLGNVSTTDSRVGRSATNDLIPFLEENLVGYYESIDYSKNGVVQKLQSATTGTGINLVIVGDGFSDRDMGTNGKYEQRMREAMEHFFFEEPYVTYRNYYNVYSVKAVSKNEVYANDTETVFNCQFAGGTLVTGNDEKVFYYALKVPSIISTDDLTIITVLNSPIYAGTCYMYYNNASIGYCPVVGYNDEQYRQIICHEIGGHGFPKLADEYFYGGAIPDEMKTGYQNFKDMDWFANIDVTNNSATIRWSHFLSDSRYASEVGIYEGAFTYTYGVYRPTDHSIMRSNVGGFNAPSREAIFKRIMALSGLTYNYENFVAYDAKNRTANAVEARRVEASAVDMSMFVPLAPPVVLMHNPRF